MYRVRNLEGSIQLVANYSDWKAVKKQTITEKTDPLTVAEFLASLTNSVDGKVEFNLRKKVALDKLDKVLTELNLVKGDAVRAMEEINTRTVSKVINEISQIPDGFRVELQKEYDHSLNGLVDILSGINMTSKTKFRKFWKTFR